MREPATPSPSSIATLGTDIDDAGARLQAGKPHSVRHAKAAMQGLRAAMFQHTMLLMAPTIVTLPRPASAGRTRPMFNVTISNVPGPDKPLFFRGAELVSITLVSIVTHGQALNITCESYGPAMNFGHRLPFVAAEPQEAGLAAVHAAEALTMAATFLPPPKPSTAGARLPRSAAARCSARCCGLTGAVIESAGVARARCPSQRPGAARSSLAWRPVAKLRGAAEASAGRRAAQSSICRPLPQKTPEAGPSASAGR